MDALGSKKKSEPGAGTAPQDPDHTTVGKEVRDGQQEQGQQVKAGGFKLYTLEGGASETVRDWFGKAIQAGSRHGAHPGSKGPFVSNRPQPLIMGK